MDSSSDSMCSMYSTDKIEIDFLRKTQFTNDFVLHLDRYMFTYDPNENGLNSKGHLKWNWKCINKQLNVSRNELFTSTQSNEYSKYITENISYANTYQFIMEVRV
eukprot:28483_1